MEQILKQSLLNYPATALVQTQQFSQNQEPNQFETGLHLLVEVVWELALQ